MRCKVGDLAIIVGTHPSYTEYLGRLVTVLKWRPDFSEWEIDLEHPSAEYVCILDDDLRPIRDNDGEDETLTWKQLERV